MKRVSRALFNKVMAEFPRGIQTYNHGGGVVYVYGDTAVGILIHGTNGFRDARYLDNQWAAGEGYTRTTIFQHRKGD